MRIQPSLSARLACRWNSGRCKSNCHQDNFCHPLDSVFLFFNYNFLFLFSSMISLLIYLWDYIFTCWLHKIFFTRHWISFCIRRTCVWCYWELSNRYTNGFVSGVVRESEDPEWSVNFKKGCLGLLQVNLEKSKLIEASEPVYTEDYAGVTVNEAYTVMEVSWSAIQQFRSVCGQV